MSSGRDAKAEEKKAVPLALRKFRDSWTNHVSKTLNTRDTWAFLKTFLDVAEQQPEFTNIRTASGNPVNSPWLYEAKRMYEEAKQFAMTCGGEILLPNVKPMYKPLGPAVQRMVNLFLTFDPATQSDIYQMAMLYGTAGSGKTVTAQLIAYEIREKMAELYLRQARRLNPSANNPGSAELWATKAKADAGRLVKVYFVDAMTLRSSPPKTWASRLRNILECVNLNTRFESIELALSNAPINDNRYNKPAVHPISILILDNLETLFMTTAELNKTPRPARQSQQISTFQYRSLATSNRTAGTAARIAGPAGSATKSTRFSLPIASPTGASSLRTGGHHARGIKTNRRLPLPLPLVRQQQQQQQHKRAGGQHPFTGFDSTRQFEIDRKLAEQEIDSLFNQDQLQSQFSNTRILFTVRYSWELPRNLLSALQSDRQIFIDLPIESRREYYVRSRLKALITDNLFAMFALIGALNKEIAVQTGVQSEQKISPSTAIRTYLREQFPLSPFWIEPNAPEVLRVANDRRTESNQNDAFEFIPVKHTLLEYDQELVYRLMNMEEKDSIVTENGLSLPSGSALLTWLETTAARDPRFKQVYRSWIALINHKDYESIVRRIVDQTGMSSEGECRLEAFLGKEQLYKMYLKITTREREGLSPGTTLYGFTLEELQRLFTALKETTYRRVIQHELNAQNAYVVGAPDAFAAMKCRESNDIDRNVSINEQRRPYRNPDSVNCRLSLNRDFRDAVTDRPVFSMWAQFGSHLMTDADVTAVFENPVQLNQTMIDKDEYAHIVRHMMSQPTVPLPSDEIERRTKKCNAEKASRKNLSAFGRSEDTLLIDVQGENGVEDVELVAVTTRNTKPRDKSRSRSRSGNRSTRKRKNRTGGKGHFASSVSSASSSSASSVSSRSSSLSSSKHKQHKQYRLRKAGKTAVVPAPLKTKKSRKTAGRTKQDYVIRALVERSKSKTKPTTTTTTQQQIEKTGQATHRFL